MTIDDEVSRADIQYSGCSEMAGTVHETSRNIGELMPRLEAADSERYLYRGQNGVFGPDGDFTRQIPAVFRGCTSPADARKALQKSRRRAAWLFDSVRKAAEIPADDSSWSLHFAAMHLGDLSRPQSPSAILGLVQHYGIPTECLDLTNLEPAAVFATQRWLTIDEALSLRPGQLVPPASRGELAFLYRYDVEKLLELGLPVGDLSTGNAGSRAGGTQFRARLRSGSPALCRRRLRSLSLPALPHPVRLSAAGQTVADPRRGAEDGPARVQRCPHGRTADRHP
jgi:hypothetical protein